MSLDSSFFLDTLFSSVWKTHRGESEKAGAIILHDFSDFSRCPFWHFFGKGKLSRLVVKLSFRSFYVAYKGVFSKQVGTFHGVKTQKIHCDCVTTNSRLYTCTMRDQPSPASRTVLDWKVLQLYEMARSKILRALRCFFKMGLLYFCLYIFRDLFCVQIH